MIVLNKMPNNQTIKDLSNIKEDTTYSKCPYCGNPTPEGFHKYHGITYPYDVNIQGYDDEYAKSHYGVTVSWNEIYWCKKCKKEYYIYCEH